MTLYSSRDWGVLLLSLLISAFGLTITLASAAEDNAAAPIPEDSPTSKLKRLLPSSHYKFVDPIQTLHGNLHGTNAIKLANMATSDSAGKAPGKVLSSELQPFIILIEDDKTFQKVWGLAGVSVLASTPVSTPKIDFSKHGALFVVPYKSRSGGKPPTLRNISFHMKKQFLLLEFDEDDLFRSNVPQSGHVTTSAIGSPWFLGVFDKEYLQKPAIINVRDW